MSINVTTPHQSEAPFVGERVFQNRGVCLQAFPPLPTPTPLRRPFCSRPNFRAARMRKKLFARTGTLATQAGIEETVCDAGRHTHCRSQISRVAKTWQMIVYDNSFRGNVFHMKRYQIRRYQIQAT